MKKLYFISALLMAIFWYSCTKDTRFDNIDPNAPAPAPVTDVKVDPTAGGAMLTYKIPSDPNLLYVKAVYEIQPGVFREAKSSIFTDTLRLVGFGDTLSHEVKLYSIGKNEKASEPVSVNVNPKTPPVQTVFANAILISTFGGVNVAFTNPDEADVSIVVIVDSTGNNTWAPVTTFYTGALTGNFSSRGFESVEKKFGLFIRDRWNNKSDTLIKMLTPRFESVISKDTWSVLVLPTDQQALAGTQYPLTRIYDGQFAALSNQSYASANASTLPQWFTIDLGKKVLMSRFKEHQAASSHLYVASGVLTFELWGSNSPDTDGGWKNWDLLGTFHSFKPSGLPLGTSSAEDKNYANFLGEDFDFTVPPPAYQFIRWKTLETYSSTGQVVIAEIDIFGEVVL